MMWWYALVFVIGLGLGAAFTHSFHDNQWGHYNMKIGRKWSWRPYHRKRGQ